MNQFKSQRTKMKKANLTNLSNSFLAHFGAPTFHATIPEIDNVLKDHKKVVVLLFDGMGQNIIRKHLNANSCIRKNYLTTIESTFPPTTTAATTAFLTALSPIETGWLAWAQYFESYKRNIILFKGSDYNTGEQLMPHDLAWKILPLNHIFDIIKKYSPDTDVFDIKCYPIQEAGPKSIKDLYKRINDTLKKTDKCFAYFYIDSPDLEMHVNGIDHPLVKQQVQAINQLVMRAVKKNPDTLFFTIADHGHIDVKYLDICDHDDLYRLLTKPISFEKRTPCFFVEQKDHDLFMKLFNKYYGKHFSLFTKEEVLNRQLFGEGKINPKAVEFIGDFIATSKDEYSIYASKEMVDLELLKGHHAGHTKEEMLIDVSVFNV